MDLTTDSVARQILSVGSRLNCKKRSAGTSIVVLRAWKLREKGAELAHPGARLRVATSRRCRCVQRPVENPISYFFDWKLDFAER